MTENARNRWRLTLRLRSPLQIGAGTLGMVEKTELFIPGRVLWGALTNTLVQLHAPRPVRPDHFTAVGEQLVENGAHFGTLFPVTGGVEDAWRPRYCADESTRLWFRGKESTEESISEQALRQRLIVSHTSTPYDPLRGMYDLVATGVPIAVSGDETGDDGNDDDPGMLHATDLIAPRHREDAGRVLHPTCFTGYLDLPEFINIGDVRIPFDEVLMRRVAGALRLGGGRRRGWGEVALVAFLRAEGPLREEPLPEGGRWILAPDHAVHREHEGALGRAVLAVYRKYDNTPDGGYGRATTNARLCWEVGSVLPA
jgi:hypothetical protein